MKLRAHTLAVLLRKDFRLMMTNKNVIILMMLPLGFALLYQTIFGDVGAKEGFRSGFVLTLCGILNLSAVPLNGLAMMVAEEKEKNTLRVLMLSDVSALEYIASKVISTLILMEIISILLFFITGTNLAFLPMYLLITTLTSISILLFGAVIGLISKDQMSTSTLSTPLMVLFLIPPMFGQMNSILKNIADLVPTTRMLALTDAVMNNEFILQMKYFTDFAVILIWIVLGVIVFTYMYRKKGFDN